MADVYVFTEDYQDDTETTVFSNKEALSAFLLEYVIREVREVLEELSPEEWAHEDDLYEFYKRIVTGQFTDGIEAFNAWQTEGYQPESLAGTDWCLLTIVDDYTCSEDLLKDDIKPLVSA